MAAPTVVLLGEELAQPRVGSLREGGRAPLGPPQRLVVPAVLQADLGDPHIVVGVGEVPAHDGDELVHVAGQRSQRPHHLGDPEPLALVAAPTGVPGSQGRHTGPLGLGQPAVRAQPLGAEHVGVGCRGTEEGLPVGTQLPPEQPLGQLLGVRPGPDAGRVVEVTEPFQDAAQVAIGVVDPAQRLLDRLDGVLGELHHRLGVTVVKERLDPVDHLLDVVGAGQGRAVVLVVVGFHGTVDGGSEGGQIHTARPAARRLQ
jgi:hypothetical protein